VIYLDSSALVKLVRKEAESATLQAWLTGRRSPIASSSLARTEVVRAVRADDALVGKARRLISGLALMPMNEPLLDAAADLWAPLRTLDAIHLASALNVRTELQAFVAYDKRLLAAAEQAGLPVASPGAS
jgi:predicted nucleic acid-binding protein